MEPQVGPTTTAAHIELETRPPVSLVSSTRMFLSDLYKNLLLDEDTLSRVALTAHELLENLAKYSSLGPTSLHVRLTERCGQSFMEIRTRNKTTPEQLTDLRHSLDEIRDAADPIALYYDIIARTAECTEGSGLGLARIRAEALMDLSYMVDGDEVTIVAEGPVETRSVA